MWGVWGSPGNERGGVRGSGHSAGLIPQESNHPSEEEDLEGRDRQHTLTHTSLLRHCGDHHTVFSMKALNEAAV